MRYISGFLIILIFCFSVVGAAFLGFHFWKIETAKTTIETPTLFEVKKGDRAGAVLQNIFENSFEPHILKLWMRQNPNLLGLKAGIYEIPAHAQVRTILELFISGKTKSYQITLLEGTRVSDMLETLKNNQNLKHEIPEGTTETDLAKLLDLDGHKNLEGLFLPDTYTFSIGDTDLSILKRAYKAEKDYLEVAYKKRAENLPYASSYEALIMASIIEKESAVASERPQVASVFVNRLRKGMKLQTDPTVIYGVKDRYKGKIYESFLTDVNPYNTYVIQGLPPTPIAAPGRDAIDAALHPDDTPYLYFVAKGPDSREGHVFSETDIEHQKAVLDYRKSVKEYKESLLNPATTNKLKTEEGAKPKDETKPEDKAKSEAESKSEANVEVEDKSKTEVDTKAEDKNKSEGEVKSKDAVKTETESPSKEAPLNSEIEIK